MPISVRCISAWASPMSGMADFTSMLLGCLTSSDNHLITFECGSLGVMKAKV